MALQDKDLYLIDQYLTNKLTKEEELLFKTYEKKAAFQEALVAQKEITEAIKLKNRTTIKSRLQIVEKNLQQQKSAKIIPMSPTKFGRRFRIFAVAASFAILMLTLWWLVPTTSPDYYSIYFEPYPNIIAPIQKSEQEYTLEQQAYQAYERKDYSTAQKLFQQLESTHTHQFYQAIIALETEQLKVATAYLEQLYQQPTARFQLVAGWYLALAYIKNGETEKAKPILTDISQTENHPFQKKAVELNKKL